MNSFQGKAKLFLLSVFAIASLSFNEIIAGENILYQKNYPVNSNGSLVINMIAADISVVSCNDNKVTIIVEGSDALNEYLKFQFSHSENNVELVAEKKKDSSGWNIFDDFEIKVKVPKEFNLDLTTSGGDVEVKYMNGEIEIVTSGGDIEVDNSEGKLSAKTSGGDVEIDGFLGNAIMKTSGGDIEGKGISGIVEARTSGGDIELSVSNGSLVANTSGGDISLNYSGENKGVELNTSGGDISILIPNSFSADVVLKTSDGDIKNNFRTVQTSKITESKFEGKYNGGGASLSAKTSGGSITVNQK
jgi:hypothetical protein